MLIFFVLSSLIRTFADSYEDICSRNELCRAQ